MESKEYTFLLTTLNSKYIHSNLAIRILYQLNKADSRLSWKEFTIKEDFNSIADFCSVHSLIAFSCYIWNIEQTLAVAKLIKEKNPHCKILLGGPEVSYEYEDIISKSYIDYIIIGEGEEPFKKILENFPSLEQIPSLVYKTNNEIKKNPVCSNYEVKFLENVFPYINDSIEELKNKVLYIETSRGCPYKCEFCLASMDNMVRNLPLKQIKENLIFMMEHGKVIKFLDRTFNIRKDFTIEIFEFILQNFKKGNIFQFEITADILHPDIIKYIQEKVPKSLFRFEIGIQTVNQKANLEVNRKQNFDKTKAVIDQVRNHVELHLDLIVGLPFDYWSDIKYSFEEVFKIFAPELQLGFLKFLKGTPVKAKHKNHGYIFDAKSPYQIIRSNYLSEKELHQITLLEHALEIYWNKKRAPETLKYITSKYGSFDFLLELGQRFHKHYLLHKHSLIDVYDNLINYVSEKYSHDLYLKEMIAIEYHLCAKIKPQNRYIGEIDYKQKKKIIVSNKWDNQNFSYLIIDTKTNIKEHFTKGNIQENYEGLAIQYNGRDVPKVMA